MGLERKSAGGLELLAAPAGSRTTLVSTFSTGLTTPREREVGSVHALLLLLVAGLLRKVEKEF